MDNDNESLAAKADRAAEAAGGDVEPATPKKKASFVHIFKSAALEPDRIFSMKLIVDEQYRDEFEDAHVLHDGSDAETVIRWRMINNGANGKPADAAAGYVFLCKKKFRGFVGIDWNEPTTKDILRRDEYESDRDWLLNHPFGKELMQWVGPTILASLVPSIEAETAKN